MSAEEQFTEQPIEQVLVTSARTEVSTTTAITPLCLTSGLLPRLVSRRVQKNMHCVCYNLRVFPRGASKFLIFVIPPLQIRDDLVDTSSQVEECCTASVCTLLVGLLYWLMVLIMQKVQVVQDTVHKQGT